MARKSVGKEVTLFCSVCGCSYMEARQAKQVGYPWPHKAGDLCLDQSGGRNTPANPCPGVLEAGEYTDEIRRRQLRSLFLTEDYRP